MRIFRFDAAVGRPLTEFGSHDVVITPIMRTKVGMQAAVMHIQPGGVVAYHPATWPQLFMIVQGEGWVRGTEPEHTPIAAGQAAFWVPGENHESGSETGMVAVVLEGEDVDPTVYMVDMEEI